MKIIILGAGQVGGTLAENLASEANDITVVDLDANRLRALQDRLDTRRLADRLAITDTTGIEKQPSGRDWWRG